MGRQSRRKHEPSHREEVEARLERRAERNARMWQLGPAVTEGKPRPTTTPPEARAKIAKDKIKQDRKRLKRMSDAAATAEGRRWKGS